ncbi:MAG: T9SS type A sorting domain-containing protein [Candidatus Latescibacterota bacterium]
MKKMFLFSAVVFLCASVASAAPFSPTLLKLSAPQNIQYDFDGKDIVIPVTVSGTQASVLFVVSTKDKAATIKKVRNGYLGWHYVNKIDTCIYISPLKPLNLGSETIIWNGKDENGNLTPAGDYTYYLWGYDHVSPKTRVAKYNIYPVRSMYLEEYGPDGKPLANPLYVKKYAKWTIGNDPEETALAEATSVSDLATPWSSGERMALDPTDHGYFYVQASNSESRTQQVRRYQWVPGGTAVRDTEWGDEGAVNLTTSYTFKNGTGGVNSDGEYIYTTFRDSLDPNSDLYAISLEGEMVRKFDLSEFWVSADEKARGGDLVASLNTIADRHGYVFLSGHGSCMKTMVNPAASIEDGDNFWSWANGNGDYVNDHNFAPDAVRPWVCFDFNVAPYNYNISADDNLFTILPAYGMGAVSFSLNAPDGTGIGYFLYAGETAAIKWGSEFCDVGSAFDGLYTDNNSMGSKDDGTNTGLWFIAHDSIKGTIGNQIAVKESAPAAFTVAQNTPNPFNPTTTISFTLTKAGKTTIEIYNAAGQKMDTLLNATISAGSHSVQWNSSNCSAGVYFYTVKSGSFSKTMKMTLLK